MEFASGVNYLVYWVASRRKINQYSDIALRGIESTIISGGFISLRNIITSKLFEMFLQKKVSTCYAII